MSKGYNYNYFLPEGWRYEHYELPEGNCKFPNHPYEAYLTLRQPAATWQVAGIRVSSLHVKWERWRKWTCRVIWSE